MTYGGNEEELYDLFWCGAFIFIKNFIVIIAKCLQNLGIIESSNFCAMLAKLQMFKISSMKHDLELWVCPKMSLDVRINYENDISNDTAHMALQFCNMKFNV